jgi:mRNA-degrading endonuclease RelE of RelBE toxin-antitoxin system
MSYKIIPTHTFDRELKRLAKKHRSIKADVYELGEMLEKNPTLGDEVIENCYKIRMAITNKGKGKSGGARIITYVYVAQETVFLLSIYDKGEQEDIGNHELKTLIEALGLEE